MLLPLLLARVEMARLLMLLTLALQLEVTAQWIAELAKDGVGVSAPGGPPGPRSCPRRRQRRTRSWSRTTP